ncbi:hypothetical protein BUE76_18625 [Cnuella takakiae]|nr:hypothetical protein BUE76_18625 [Cnuella takakiae]
MMPLFALPVIKDLPPDDQGHPLLMKAPLRDAAEQQEAIQNALHLFPAGKVAQSRCAFLPNWHQNLTKAQRDQAGA